MLTLYGGLCLGRNYIAMDMLQQLYPLDVCYAVASNTEYDLPLRKKMVRLLIHLWVDRAPYSKTVLPDRIRIWHEIERKNDTTIPSTAHDFS